MGDYYVYSMLMVLGSFLFAFIYTLNDGYILTPFIFQNTWIIGMLIIIAVIAAAF